MIRTQRRDGFKEFIAICYVFFLTLRMSGLLVGFFSFLHGAGYYFDVFFHALGLLSMVASNQGSLVFSDDEEGKNNKNLFSISIWFAFSSLIMACIIQYNYGYMYTETAFSAVSGQIVYFFQYSLMVYYNRYVFGILGTERVLKIIKIEVGFLLILGIIQFSAKYFGGVFSYVYEKLDIFDFFGSMTRSSKLKLTGIEGSSAGNIIGIFVLPFLLSGMLTEKRRLKHYIVLVLWIPIMYATQSSICYMLSSAAIIVYFILKYKRAETGMIKLIVLIGIISTIWLFFTFPELITYLFPGEIGKEVQYLLLRKIVDLENGSTVTRLIPFITNWKTFLEYPLLGVGNGCQGYFYTKHFPIWAFSVAGSDAKSFYNTSLTTIGNGGLFLPSVLSGYGIVGFTFFISYTLKCDRMARLKKDSLDRWYYYYRIAFVPIILLSLQGEFAGMYYVWFILSIPYIIPKPYPIKEQPE